jgi:uncharacterized protein YqeY
MTLKQKIKKDSVTALKAKDTLKLSILRFLIAQIQNAEIDRKRQALNDEQVVKIITSQIKKLKDSLELFKKGNRPDLVQKTEAEIKILSSYLPQQLSDEELKAKITSILKENPTPPHPGALIGLCVKALAGQADNQRIAQMVKAHLSNQK